MAKEKYQHVPREMMAEEERQTRTVIALENIAVSARTICAYLQMLTEGFVGGEEIHAAPKRKKAPSLAKRHAKRR